MAHHSRVACLFALTIAFEAEASDLHVPGTYPTIQDAVIAASDDDRVLVSAGIYVESVSLLGKSIELAPATPGAEVILRGPVNQRALRFTSGEGPACVVRGLRLEGALPSGAYGGGILVDGSSPRVESCSVTGVAWNASAGTWGGAVDVVSGSPHFGSCTFVGNRVLQSTAADGGAVLVRGGDATLDGCLFRTNGAAPATQGSDLFLVSSAHAQATLVNCRFEGSGGGGFGARIYNYGQGGSAGIVTLRDSSFSGIVQQAVSLVHGWDSIQMERVRFEDCIVTGYPESGAPGVLVTQSRSALAVSDCEFRRNSCNNLIGTDPTQGGAARVQGSFFCGNSPAAPDFGPTIADLGGNRVVSVCCTGDVVADGAVNGADLGVLLTYWGPVSQSQISRACDLNSDGIVDGADLGLLLSFWGVCPN